ncbi:acetyl/propionyl-CoA carboxylase, alpha subunit [Desulfosporosinus orientis DSM 765]|uniref:Acetyl/propionyl-CoA carboxylase, alpha subunit n=1 Tax=Desulfosporosinus orientis (strain ATCC 19365 / DSM 765 / NCIMB 8382 / VKM B-1628 / Singapore I) TaxID=768706 RepID=G7WHS7_DESOD|nr:acetyl-CoA carboxylase biotin carboxyl carrier protein subunit [Desulfosporosinus orientis]AET69639.1 acetyl/propionyl-CoA carboxylase, alpha subunit [Desulfosporosinus orientis DSM 765]
MKILANMSGLINDIRVKEGELVNAGDVVAVIESMKMLIDLKSESTGVITKVVCQLEEFVQEGQLLFEGE